MLDRVVTIDNVEEEINDLVSRLGSYDIAVDKLIVEDDFSTLPVYTRNRQLIFMDLMFDEDESHLVTNISRVIQILNHIVGEGFGPYGLVLWTKHKERQDQVIERLNKAAEKQQDVEVKQDADDEEIEVEIHLNNPPIFMLCIDKVQFLMSGKWDFSNLLPILNQEIQKSNASYFFLRWLSASRQASQETISNIYDLAGGYENKEKELSHILYRLALNHTGIRHGYSSLTSDAYKAFTGIQHSKINSLTGKESLPDLTKVGKAFEDDEERVILAQLNKILLFDNVGIDQNEIVPGNIYRVMKEDNPVYVKEEHRVEFMRKNETEHWENYKNYTCVPIAIELTPPCDFSNKKVRSRVVGGYIADYSANNENKQKIESSDKNYVIKPIFIPGDDNMKYVIFDFRHLYSPQEEDLKDPTKYKVIFRATHPLFSDVLQKFSSHAARLGLNLMEPDKRLWK